MKYLLSLFAIQVLFTFSTNVNSQVDSTSYSPMPLPERTPLLDSSFTENDVHIFSAETQSFTNSLGVSQSLKVKRSAPSNFTKYTEEAINDSRQFNNLVPADQIGILTDYPIRTVVKLNITMYDPSNGQTSNVSCSGVMVGNDEVMTAGHCVDAGGNDPSYATAITVIPAYNLGSSPFGSAQMTQWLSFTQWTDNGNWDYDIAMVKLAQPMGDVVGWLGFGYNMNNAFFTSQSNTFHSFGYPAQNDAGQTVFEGGERMYYMNGFMDYFESANSMCHYNIGFKGQSGSGLYYNDNGNRYVYGVLSHGSNQVPNTCHTRIDSWMFDHFLDFLGAVSIEENTNSGLTNVYPNPSSSGIFTFDFKDESSKQIEIFNSTGQLIRLIEDCKNKSTNIDLSNVSAGIYHCAITQGKQLFRSKLIKL